MENVVGPTLVVVATKIWARHRDPFANRLVIINVNAAYFFFFFFFFLFSAT